MNVLQDFLHYIDVANTDVEGIATPTDIFYSSLLASYNNGRGYHNITHIQYGAERLTEFFEAARISPSPVVGVAWLAHDLHTSSCCETVNIDTSIRLLYNAAEAYRSYCYSPGIESNNKDRILSKLLAYELDTVKELLQATLLPPNALPPFRGTSNEQFLHSGLTYLLYADFHHLQDADTLRFATQQIRKEFMDMDIVDYLERRVAFLNSIVFLSNPQLKFLLATRHPSMEIDYTSMRDNCVREIERIYDSPDYAAQVKVRVM